MRINVFYITGTSHRGHTLSRTIEFVCCSIVFLVDFCIQTEMHSLMETVCTPQSLALARYINLSTLFRQWRHSLLTRVDKVHGPARC